MLCTLYLYTFFPVLKVRPLSTFERPTSSKRSRLFVCNKHIIFSLVDVIALLLLFFFQIHFCFTDESSLFFITRILFRFCYFYFYTVNLWLASILTQQTSVGYNFALTHNVLYSSIWLSLAQFWPYFAILVLLLYTFIHTHIYFIYQIHFWT